MPRMKEKYLSLQPDPTSDVTTSHWNQTEGIRKGHESGLKAVQLLCPFFGQNPDLPLLGSQFFICQQDV